MALNLKLQFLLPELYLLAIICILFVQSISNNLKDKTKWLPYAAFAGIFVTIFSFGQNGYMLYNTYKIDGLSQFFKFVIFLGFAICTANASQNKTIKQEHFADYFFFMALSTFGLVILSSTVELFSIYVALELASYSLYVLIPLRNKEARAAEAGIKYVIFGAVATALGLYGISYIIAGQHTTFIHALASMDWSWTRNPMPLIGFGLFSLAFLYKLALFPFHFWCPDVYQGTSNETAAFAATMPKLGAIVVLIRIMAMMPGDEVKTIIAIFAAFSMTIGNLAALNQKDIKRLLGYSSVSHAGYIMLGLVSGTAYGLSAAAFYGLVYMLMNLTIFWVITRLSSTGRNIYVDDLNGLYHSCPALAFVLAVAAFALVGLPPTAGFAGKLFLLGSAWGQNFNWLVIVGAVNTGIAIYYYLNLVRHAYTVKEVAAIKYALSPSSTALALLLSLGVLYLGIIPQDIFNWLMKTSQIILS